MFEDSSSMQMDAGPTIAPASQPHGAEWRRLDQRLRGYARQRATLDAAEGIDLVRAEQMRLYAFFGYVSHWEYMERVLGYGPHAARERMRVARTLCTLPETARAFASGERNYSQIRALTRVATLETEAEWLAETAEMTADQVEETVAGHAVGDRPSDPKKPNHKPRKIWIELAPEHYAMHREAHRQLCEERGGEVSEHELREELYRRFFQASTGEERPAHQIAYKQCPNC